MAYFTQTVEVDIDLDDFGDDELVEELESRGFYVSDHEFDIVAIEDCWNSGQKKEALILLERKFRELRGISNLLD
jgi:hypothetical protein